ncbi:MAG: ATP-binding protein [Candidatus Korobacteraceae bacterium]|jgi:signal transduction histidine kinase
MALPTQSELDQLLGGSMFELVPFNVAVIDREFRIIAGNGNFEEYFGTWQNRRCYDVCKRASRPCEPCALKATFGDGRLRVSDETGVDRHGRTRHYVAHLVPMRDTTGQITHVMAMTTDLTETRSWKREYDRLFERVPGPAFVIDRNYRLTQANDRFREIFGVPEGQFCYEVCKRRRGPCRSCTAALTFADGSEHVSNEVGVHKDGSTAHYVVASSPVFRGQEGISHVILMGTDISELSQLKRELQKTHAYYEALIRNSPTGIIAVDSSSEPKVVNPAARALLEWTTGRLPTAARLRQMLPEQFFAADAMPEGKLDLSEVPVRSAQQQQIPVRFSAVELRSGRRRLGRAAFMEDLREIKRLEQEKLDAERLAAVGQTVAGLAHTIKNLLMGLEGGMYMVDSGLSRGDASRITAGWQMLQRNFEKTNGLVKDFLSFAKGRLPALRPTDPNALARDIVALYVDAARLQGVELKLDLGAEVKEAPLDVQGMETCITNLLSNGIDAAAMRIEGGGQVILRTCEQAGDLLFEVVDNGGGMDWEISGKVFTTFFTTKGNKGTGLGLLTTRKIVQEHDGRIDVESKPGKGATFRIRLSRQRLQAIANSASGPAS